MKHSLLYNSLETLKNRFSGDLFVDEATRLIYATDASAYREKPLAVARPANVQDVKELIELARATRCSLIPRAAGTSLAGQVVGNGIVVDVSKYMTRILEINPDEKWVRVEPGVILSELNQALAQVGLFFGPETSTANRCMMGGMLGNNACGAHSLVYGSTRDHTLEIKALLSDGSECLFKALTVDEFVQYCEKEGREGEIYRNIRELLNDEQTRLSIAEEYPHPRLRRRNTGYAIDLLANTEVFQNGGNPFNFCTLLAGSEGTLAFTTEIKLNLVPLPPQHKALVCVHLETIRQALEANLIALKLHPVSIELMDKTVMDLTKANIEQRRNRFFVKGDPGAILIVEFAEQTPEKVEARCMTLENECKKQGYGFHFPVIKGRDMNRVWDLRKAGLGVLNNMPGDAKPVPVIEDTAVHPELLPDYIDEIQQMLASFGKECVYYAHIATGELHLRPILNLKDAADVELFHSIAFETARIVKKYKGSLSGEHGDGRLRGEFIPLMIGEQNYALLQKIKDCWDPDHLLNPNKIVGTPPMNRSLRYDPAKKEREISTVFNFSKDQGILRAAEKCNGSADCRKTELSGGTMCPSYMASRDEKSTTRARANVLREYLTHSEKENPFDHHEIYDIMDLCLSCKACKSECPSSVDVAKLKAEFLQHFYDANGAPLRSKLVAHIARINSFGMIFPWLTNALMQNRITGKILKKTIGFSTRRSLPTLYHTSLDRWFANSAKSQPQNSIGKVCLFNDEFTRFNDTEIGIKTVLLLYKLGYEVVMPRHLESGRTWLSKGFVRKAKEIVTRNVEILAPYVETGYSLVGIEPSAILTFRDEVPELVDAEWLEKSNLIAENAYTIEEFLVREFEAGRIVKERFTAEKKEILYHGHCQQKSIASTKQAIGLLSIPSGWTVKEIPSGCCGMAGSFGFEKEHYDLSMKVGELVLFPAVRAAQKDVVIAASGTSCRHQIKEGTARKAQHPVELLADALLKETN